jgi:putative ABC transport system permease protein
MSTLSAAAPTRRLAWRLALRDLRGGLAGFRIFIACIALGVMAIAGVNALAQGFVDGLARDGRVILGGDLSFSLIQREARAVERGYLSSLGTLSTAATLRTMARNAGGRAALVELKAVDGLYPLYGAVVTEPAIPLPDLFAARDGRFGAAVDPTLLTRLQLKVGDILSIGDAKIELRAVLKTEPDKIAAGIAFGPRLMISDEALRATGLIQPGSLVRWLYRLRIDGASEAALAADVEAARAAFPDAGWEIRTRTNSSPQLEQNVQRFAQYLTLVGLAALLIGGVGVANATRHFIEKKRDVIATLKAVGASGARVVRLYVVEVLLIALVGIGLGLGVAAALPFIVAAVFGAIMPLPFIAALHPTALLLGLAYGLLTALTFALWPLGAAHDVPVSALFRGEVAPEARRPRRRYIVATVVSLVALAVLAIVASYDRRIAAIFIAAAAGSFVLLRLIAILVMAAARRAPHVRSTALRLAIANIHRPGALTPTVVLSLGLGLALLVTVLEIDGNLRRQFTAALPARAPSFFFLDIGADQAPRFDEVIRTAAPRANVERVPMLRGRIISARGTDAADLKAKPDAQWVLQSDRGITFADAVPAGSRVAAGKWWPKDYDGPPLVSMERRIADGLGLELGDEITVNVLGRNIAARIANLRTLDWQSLGINFVLVYSPNTFRGAPVSEIATVTFPGGGSGGEDEAVFRQVTDAFPAVTAVRVKDALDAIGALVGNLVLAIRSASAVTLFAAALVLGGALAAGYQHRVYDAVILKTLGATRRRVLIAYGLEYGLLALATAVFGIAIGSLAAWRIIVDIMTLPFVWMPSPALTAVVAALAITLLFGLAGTFAALSRKPAPVLRSL